MNKLIQRITEDKKILLALFMLLILPLILGGVYYVQKTRTQAIAAGECQNPITTRISTIKGEITCATDEPVVATAMCKIGLDGVSFFCGKDAESTMSHRIEVNNLNPGVGYYAEIDTGAENTIEVYIPADPDNPIYSLSFESFSNEDNLWLCREDEGYNPALDIDQNGCVNLLDSLYFFDEEEAAE